MKITTKTSVRWLSVYINGLLHLRVRYDGLKAIQSWEEGDKGYRVEFSYDDGESVLAEYDQLEKFTAVLKALDEIRM